MTIFFIGFGLLRLLGFAFLILLFIKIATIVRFKMHGKHLNFLKTHGTYHAISIAAERFAEGKISNEQYREIKMVLNE